MAGWSSPWGTTRSTLLRPGPCRHSGPGQPLTPALREEILAIDGVTDVVVTRQSLSLRYQLAGDASVHSTGMGDVLTQQNWDAVAAALLAGAMPEGDRSVLVASMWRRPTRRSPRGLPGGGGGGDRSPSPWRGSLTPPRRLPSEGATGTWAWTPPSSMPGGPVPAAAAGGGFPGLRLVRGQRPRPGPGGGRGAGGPGGPATPRWGWIPMPAGWRPSARATR